MKRNVLVICDNEIVASHLKIVLDQNKSLYSSFSETLNKGIILEKYCRFDLIIVVRNYRKNALYSDFIQSVTRSPIIGIGFKGIEHQGSNFVNISLPFSNLELKRAIQDYLDFKQKSYSTTTTETNLLIDNNSISNTLLFAHAIGPSSIHSL